VDAGKLLKSQVKDNIHIKIYKGLKAFIKIALGFEKSLINIVNLKT
jgi:hypothetical protein